MKKILYQRPKKAVIVPALFWFAIAMAILALYFSWNILNTYGLSPGGDGILKPFEQRLALAVFIATLGLAFVGAMMLYGSLFVIQLSQEGKNVVITTLGMFGSRSQQRHFTTAQIRKTQIFTPDPGEGTPWVGVYVTDQRLPFMLLIKADIINTNALKKLAH